MTNWPERARKAEKALQKALMIYYELDVRRSMLSHPDKIKILWAQLGRALKSKGVDE